MATPGKPLQNIYYERVRLEPWHALACTLLTSGESRDGTALLHLQAAHRDGTSDDRHQGLSVHVRESSE